MIAFLARVERAFRFVFFPQPDIVGGGLIADGQPPVDQSAIDEQRKYQRMHLERHLAADIFCRMVSMPDVNLTDAQVLEEADYARRAARLYANGEDFP